MSDILNFAAEMQALADRQEQRLADLPAVYTQRHEQLALELALAPSDAASVFAEHGYDTDGMVALLSQPAFAELLQRMKKEVAANGLSFKTKARVQAEDLLRHSYEMATNPEVSAAVRLDAIKSTVKWAGLEPKDKDGPGGGGGGLTLNITFAGQQPQQVVTQQPLTIEAE